MRAIFLILMSTAPMACVSGAVKEAVVAYGTAASGLANTGVALVTRCETETNADAKKAACDAARDSFKTVGVSAAKLQKVGE